MPDSETCMDNMSLLVAIASSGIAQGVLSYELRDLSYQSYSRYPAAVLDQVFIWGGASGRHSYGHLIMSF